MKRSQVLCWSLTVDGYHSKIKIKKWNGPPLSFSTTHPSPTLQSLHRLPVVLHFYGNANLSSFQFCHIFASPFPLRNSLSLSLSLAFHSQEQKISSFHRSQTFTHTHSQISSFYHSQYLCSLEPHSNFNRSVGIGVVLDDCTKLTFY